MIEKQQQETITTFRLKTKGGQWSQNSGTPYPIGIGNTAEIQRLTEKPPEVEWGEVRWLSLLLPSFSPARASHWSYPIGSQLTGELGRGSGRQQALVTDSKAGKGKNGSEDKMSHISLPKRTSRRQMKLRKEMQVVVPPCFLLFLPSEYLNLSIQDKRH